MTHASSRPSSRPTATASCCMRSSPAAACAASGFRARSREDSTGSTCARERASRRRLLLLPVPAQSTMAGPDAPPPVAPPSDHLRDGPALAGGPRLLEAAAGLLADRRRARRAGVAAGRPGPPGALLSKTRADEPELTFSHRDCGRRQAVSPAGANLDPLRVLALQRHA